MLCKQAILRRGNDSANQLGQLQVACGPQLHLASQRLPKRGRVLPFAHSTTKKNASCGSGGRRAQTRHTRANSVRGRLRWPLSTSRSIGEPLTLEPKESEFRTLYVVNPKPDAVGIAEIE